MKIKLLT